MKRTKSRPYWESLSLEVLAEQQGVAPLNDLQEVADLWPVENDPDELLRFILEERRTRRQLENERN